MRVLVIGDSQAQVIGPTLKQLSLPRDQVTVVAYPGISVAALAAKALAAAAAAPYERVYVVAGGNDSPATPDALRGLLVALGPTRVVYLPPPPATMITDLSHAKAVFGGQVKSTDQWFVSGRAGRRESTAATYAATARAVGATVADLRTAPLTGSMTQPSGVGFPAQPDGIHLGSTTAKQVAKWLLTEPWRNSTGLHGVLVGGTLVAVAWAWLRRRRGR